MNSLLKFQIGPVQEFIAQARSTRDLWSGSYLLSWLIAAGIRRLQSDGGSLVFPNPTDQPLLSDPHSWPALKDHTALLTPNLPNLFVAIVSSSSAEKMACDVKNAIEGEWKAICEAVWNHQDFIPAGHEVRFKRQVERFLSISWQITPLTGDDYAAAYERNGRRLDATRQTREFKAWSVGAVSVNAESNKDSLSGKEECLEGGPGFARRIKSKSKYHFLFKHDDWIGAITLVKRLWHLAHLKENRLLRTSSKEFRIRSTRAIAGKTVELDDDDNVETATDEKYFAVLALDGDQIGKWLNGEFLVSKDKLDSYHAEFSGALSDFALNRVQPMVLNHQGFLIYAGGDDVLALLPADRALTCAQELRGAFQKATTKIRSRDGACMDASAGIAVAHFKSPLQDVIRSAQIAEKRAKNQLGRSAVAVTLFKRSGETIEWGSKWDHGGLELYRAIAEALDRGKLSGKFTYRVAELLQHYLTETSQLTRETQSFAPVEEFDTNIREIVRREFGTVLNHQTPLTGNEKAAFSDAVTSKLDEYLQQLETKFADALRKFEERLPLRQAEPWERPRKPDFTCGSIIGLCQTVAFAHRVRGSDPALKTGISISVREVAQRNIA